MNSPESNVITVATHKEVTRLFKTFLEEIENIRKDHEILVAKVAEKNGLEYSQAIDNFPQEKYEQIRKRVLDNGNECARQLVQFLDFFDFQINNERLEKVASQKRIVKKFITSGTTEVK